MKLTYVLACAILASVLAACAGTPGGPISGSQGSVSDVGVESLDTDRAYHLAPGDEVRVNVFGETSLSGEFVVTSDGTVSMPLVGQVRAGGLTLDEFRNAVTTALSDGYLNDPRVSAEILNYRPIFILGEVSSSGEYAYSEGLTILNLVARAGGFTYRANTRVVYVKRAGTDTEVAVPLTADLRVLPGDTVRIGERFF